MLRLVLYEYDKVKYLTQKSGVAFLPALQGVWSLYNTQLKKYGQSFCERYGTFTTDTANTKIDGYIFSERYGLKLVFYTQNILKTKPVVLWVLRLVLYEYDKVKFHTQKSGVAFLPPLRGVWSTCKTQLKKYRLSFCERYNTLNPVKVKIQKRWIHILWALRLETWDLD